MQMRHDCIIDEAVEVVLDGEASQETALFSTPTDYPASDKSWPGIVRAAIWIGGAIVSWVALAGTTALFVTD